MIGTGTIARDLERWWARLRKKPDPYSRIGHKDAFESLGETILALDDVSFTVQKGEALGIIGRNGAGKSTLLKILSRVTSPTSGVVKVKGRIGSLLEVGTGFHPELTGRENVYLNGAILGMKKAEVTHKFDEIIDFSGVQKFVDTPVKRYSSGMYVRLAFAVAAHLDPEILIVDEVLAVGDAEFQKKCLGKMGDVAGEGRTVLFVSHNMGAIRSLCSSALLIQNGQISYNGEVQETIDKYLEAFQDPEAINLENKKRFGIGAVKLTRADLKNLNNPTSTSVHVGIPVEFDFYFSGPSEGVVFQFTIYNSNGEAVSSFTTNILGPEDIVDRTQGHLVKCHLNELTLIPGRYYINTAFSNAFGIQDHVDRALDFNVEQGMIEGKLLREGKSLGNVYLPHYWKIHER